MTASAPATVDEVLAKLRDELARGELVGAYDTAERARRDGLDDPLIRYRRVLALARAGATESAAKEYAELGLAEQLDTDSKALFARILKDRAFRASASERTAAFRAAAEAYEAVFTETRASFPAVNAATLRLLAGDMEEARSLAGRVLADPELAGGGYWEAATRAEARLVLSDAAGAASDLAEARRLVGGNWGDLSSTLRQLARLLDAPSLAHLPRKELLAALRPPRVAHLTGEGVRTPRTLSRPGRGQGEGAPHSAETSLPRTRSADADSTSPHRGEGSRPADDDDKLASLMRENDVGFAVVALWSEGSVAAAEAAFAAGIELTVVLPFDQSGFLAHAKAHFPPGEAARRAACVAGARSVIAVTADGDHVDERLVEYAAVVAKGLALTRAARLSTDCIDLPAVPGSAPAPTLQEGAPPPAGPGEPVRELRAILFADAKGFSKLPESELPVFWSRFMTEMAGKLDAAGGDVLFANTWGDAVFCVAARIEVAAELALAMQERAAELRREHPASPSLRIGLHHGPVFRGWDPVRKSIAYFGTQVSRAARVEPIVPPGDVYVTEPFAAVLAASGAPGFAAEYVGVLPLHKDYGEHRMYRLARR